MKYNAFTLIELLATIAILGIIAVITVPTIQNVLSDSKTKACKEQVSRVEDATERYINDKMQDINYTIETSVDIKTLQNAGYLTTDEIKDPKTNKPMTGSITITKTNNQYTFEYNYSCN